MAKTQKAPKKPVKQSRKRAAKRELINTGIDKRFVRRGNKGRFKESDDVGPIPRRGSTNQGET